MKYLQNNFQQFLKKIRESINEGKFKDFKKKFESEYLKNNLV